MPAPLHLWLRHETRPHEQRAAITPDGAAQLLAAGVRVSVESSPVRVFDDRSYADVGAAIVATGGWVDAPDDAVIVGLKDLPDDPPEIRHRHVFFGHVYKGQFGARDLLARFDAGGGTLLDMEYLVDDRGRRLAAFGFWAGYVGAALAVLHDRGVLRAPLEPTSRERLDAAMASARPRSGQAERAVVIGAPGRSGSGAVAALRAAGVEVTGWDRAATKELNRDELLGHDLMVHCVLATEPSPALLRREDLDAPGRRLRMLSDVTCDLGSDLNMVPVNDELTSWEAPVRAISGGLDPDLAVIAIDNLPSLLPRESSQAFSADLLPHLLALRDEGSLVWNRAESVYEHYRSELVGGVVR